MQDTNNVKEAARAYWGDSGWFVLHTLPQHEKKVAAYLEKANTKYYLPTILKKRYWSDRIKWVEVPLFPGYIFTLPLNTAEYKKTLQHPGALLYLHHKHRAAKIPDATIANIRIMVDNAKKDILTQPLARFEKGQIVRIKFGPLSGLEGIVEKIKGKKRIFVLVPLLNQMVSTRIDPDWIEPSANASSSTNTERP